MPTPTYVSSELLLLHVATPDIAEWRLDALLVEKAAQNKSPLSWTQKAWRFDFELVELYLALGLVKAAEELAVEMADQVTDNTKSEIEIKLFSLMSRVYQATDRWDEGVELLDDVLDLARHEVQSNAKLFRPLVAATVSELARLFYHKGDYPMADIFDEEALEKYQKLVKNDAVRFPLLVMDTYNDLGVIAAAQKERNDAEKAFNAGLELAEADASYGLQAARFHLNLGIFLADLRQDADTAKTHYQACLDTSEPLLATSQEAKGYAEAAAELLAGLVL